MPRSIVRVLAFCCYSLPLALAFHDPETAWFPVLRRLVPRYSLSVLVCDIFEVAARSGKSAVVELRLWFRLG